MSENLTNTGSVETTGTETQETKTYTQEEVDKMLQSEVDRRITSALKKQEQKNAERVKEAAKIAQMSATEKYEYELKQREDAIAAKEKALALAENRNVCSKILADKGLSLELVDFVVSETAEDMDANIKRLEKAFKQSVKTEVEKRLGSREPKQSLPLDTAMTAEKFSKLSLREMAQLQRENPEIFNSF